MPYKSEAQRRFFNSEKGKEVVGKKNVEEFNRESKGMKLPEKVGKDELGERVYTKGSKDMKQKASDGPNRPNKQLLNEFKTEMKKANFDIESERTNRLGGVHFQIRNKNNIGDDKELFRRYAMRVDTICSNLEKKYNVSITYNVGLATDGSVTAGVDVWYMITKDSEIKLLKAMDSLNKVLDSEKYFNTYVEARKYVDKNNIKNYEIIEPKVSKGGKYIVRTKDNK